MRAHLLVTGLSLLLFSFSALAQGNKTVVAKVGSKIITLDELNRRYDEIRRQAINPPPKRVFLEDLVRYEMGVQEAEKRGLAKDPVVAERLRQELYKGLLEKELGDKINAIQVSEDDMRKFYSEYPEIRTSHILIEVKPNATPQERAAAKKRAEEIYSEVRASKRPFEDLVKLYTDDVSTKRTGGDLGFQTKLTLVPAYYEAAERLKVGEISHLVETPYGYHIIKVTGRHKFEEANKRALRAAVFEHKKIALYNDYFAKLKKSYDVSVNLDAVK